MFALNKKAERKSKKSNDIKVVSNLTGLALSVIPLFPFPLTEVVMTGLLIVQSSINMVNESLSKKKFYRDPLWWENATVGLGSMGLEIASAHRAYKRISSLNRNWGHFVLSEREEEAFMAGEEPRPVLKKTEPKTTDDTLLSVDSSSSSLRKNSVSPDSLRRSPGSPDSLRRSPDSPDSLRKSPQTGGADLRHLSTDELDRRVSSDSTGLKQDSPLSSTKEPILSLDRQSSQDSMRMEETQPLLPQTRKLQSLLKTFSGRAAILNDDLNVATSYLSQGYSLSKNVEEDAPNYLHGLFKHITYFDREGIPEYHDEIKELLRQYVFTENKKEWLFWHMRLLNRLVGPIHSMANLAVNTN